MGAFGVALTSVRVIRSTASIGERVFLTPLPYPRT